MLGALDWVDVAYALGVAANEVGVLGSSCKSDQFSLVRVHCQAIMVEPGQG